MARHVFPSRELAHVFASGTLYHGRTSNGHIFFIGDTIYSYGAHAPLARILDQARHIALVTTHTYSVTTSCHLSRVVSALSNFTLIHVPNVLASSPSDHAANIICLLHELSDTRARASRARLHADHYYFNYRALRDNLILYCRHFHIRRPSRLLTDAALDELIAAWTVKSAPARARADARAESRRRTRQELWNQMVARDAAADLACTRLLALPFEERLSLWHTREIDILPLTPSDPPGDFARLSSDGTHIETSRSARILTVHAPRLWAIISSCASSGRPWVPGQEMRIDYYRLDSIDSDGTLHVGCHSIPYSESHYLARALGLII